MRFAIIGRRLLILKRVRVVSRFCKSQRTINSHFVGNPKLFQQFQQFQQLKIDYKVYIGYKCVTKEFQENLSSYSIGGCSFIK